MMIGKTINLSLRTLLALLIITLAGCSETTLRPDANQASQAKPRPESHQNQDPNDKNPPMTLMKEDKELHLLRIMDGGVCKNELEGAKGTFLIYAYQPDIERIKKAKGVQIFRSFEKKIEAFSSVALQQVVTQSNFSKNPFALDDEDAQQKLASQFAENFHDSIVPAIDKFQQETTLTIDIRAFPASFIFYQQGCKATQMDSEDAIDDEQLI